MSLAYLIPRNETFPPASRELDIDRVVGEIRWLQETRGGEWAPIDWIRTDQGILQHVVEKGHFSFDACEYIADVYGDWEAWLVSRQLDGPSIIVAPLLYTEAEAARKPECEARLCALLVDALSAEGRWRFFSRPCEAAA